MPRTLPWLIGQENEKRVKKEPTPRKRVKRELDPDLTPKQEAPISPNKDFFRSSQTPPTSPARPCPKQEFLLEGLNRDDAWIMVEDEFYAVAQSFTQHLHYAEYVRRKKEAKTRSTELDRPTDGRTSIPESVKRKKEAEDLRARQKDGLAQIDGRGDNQEPSGDDEDDTWAGTHLHGLLTSPRQSRSLVGVQGVKSSTRAAAGFGQMARSHDTRVSEARNVPPSSPPSAPVSKAAQSHIVELDISTASEDDDDLDDDLDGEFHTSPRPFNRRLVSPPSRTMESQNPTPKPPARPRQTEPANPGKSSKITTKTMSKPPKLESGFKSKMDLFFDDLDKLPEPSESDTIISNGGNDINPGISLPRKTDDDHNLKPKSRYKDVPTFIV